MLTVQQVANYFLEQASDRNQQMRHMKLQKLCYYAQGFHLGFCGEPLFDGELEAWDYGPVSRDLWGRFKYRTDGLSAPADFEIASIGQDDRDFMDIVFARFGEYNDVELSRMSHEESPWKEARAQLKSGREGVISPASMIKHFRPRLSDLDSEEAPPPSDDGAIRTALRSDRELVAATQEGFTQIEAGRYSLV